MNYRVLMLLIIFALLAACESRISTEIYIADLDELSDTLELSTDVIVGLYIPSEEECEEYQQRYESVFRESDGFRNMVFVRCYTEGYDSFAEYEMEIPMRMVDPTLTPMKSSFEVIRFDTPQEADRSYLYFRSNPSSLCNLDALIRDEFFQSLDLSELQPRITFTNDLRVPQTLILEQVFVDNAPVVEASTFEMGRRDSLEVTLSDVTTAWVFNKSCRLQSRMALVAIWER